MGSGQVALRLKGALLPSVHSRGVSSPAGAARPPIRERRSRKQATRLERVLGTARGGLGGGRAPRVCRARGQRPDGTPVYRPVPGASDAIPRLQIGAGTGAPVCGHRPLRGTGVPSGPVSSPCREWAPRALLPKPVLEVAGRTRRRSLCRHRPGRHRLLAFQDTAFSAERTLQGHSGNVWSLHGRREWGHKGSRWWKAGGQGGTAPPGDRAF